MNTAKEIAEAETKEELLRRMRYYILDQAKKKRLESWSIVGSIFGHGSGVSSYIWEEYIKEKPPQ